MGVHLLHYTGFLYNHICLGIFLAVNRKTSIIFDTLVQLTYNWLIKVLMALIIIRRGEGCLGTRFLPVPQSFILFYSLRPLKMLSFCNTGVY